MSMTRNRSDTTVLIVTYKHPCTNCRLCMYSLRKYENNHLKQRLHYLSYIERLHYLSYIERLHYLSYSERLHYLSYSDYYRACRALILYSSITKNADNVAVVASHKWSVCIHNVRLYVMLQLLHHTHGVYVYITSDYT